MQEGPLVLGMPDNALLRGLKARYDEQVAAALARLRDAGACGGRLAPLLEHPDAADFVAAPEYASLALWLADRLGAPAGSRDPEWDKNETSLGHDAALFAAGGRAAASAWNGQTIEGTGILLTRSDTNPYSGLDAHPDHAQLGVCNSWGSLPETTWNATFAKAFDILRACHPGTWDELNFMIRKIIPLSTCEKMNNSASYRECVGHLYVGYTVDAVPPELPILEAIVHESSHNKLNLASHFEPILDPAILDAPRYYSPWRPDARPMIGTLLGLHAFAAVAWFFLRALERDLLPERRLWLNHSVYNMLRNEVALKVVTGHARLAPLGGRVLAEIREVMADCRKTACRLPGFPEAAAAARGRISEHFAKTTAANRGILR